MKTEIFMECKNDILAVVKILFRSFGLWHRVIW